MCRSALRHERPRQAGQDIARAANAEASVAAGVDAWHLCRAGDDRARTLEDHGALQLFAERLSRLEPIALHVLGRAAQQAARFQWVRGDHGRALAWGVATLAQQCPPIGVLGNSVQPICIQHQAGAVTQDVAQHCLYGLATAAARHHCQL